MIELLEKRKGYVSKEIYDPIQNQAETYFEVCRPHIQKTIQNNFIIAYIKMQALAVEIELFTME